MAGEAPMHVPGGPEVQKGAHLARAADCMGCHTYKENKPYAGNKPMESPFGTFYTANLTQDKATGIGTWTFEDFKRSLHEGQLKDGNYIYPAMPYVSYTHLSDADVRALWAYFKQIKPIRNQVRDPNLIVLSDFLSSPARWVLFGWRLPYFDAHRFEPDPKRSAEYNRGEYYVKALGHCSSCHTPRNIAFAQQRDRFLNGYVLNGWYAPRISRGPDSAIKDWSVEDLASYLKKGELGKRTTVVGPMHEVWYDSLRHLPRADLRAMAVYLKNMPVAEQQPAPASVEISSQQAALGKQVYAGHCKTCHQADGKGVHGVAPALAGNSLVTSDKANSVVMSILQGFKPRDTWGAMPSFAKTLSDKEVAAVANYVRTAWHNDAPADASVGMVASSRPIAAKAVPPSGQYQAVICPNLPSKVIAPALKPGDKKILSAASNQGALKTVVSTYTSARPKAPKGDAVKALTAAYCRALVDKKSTSDAERNRALYQFSQKVADQVGM